MDEAVIKRVMPHDKDAEKSVIGSMLMDRNAVTKAKEILVREDFYIKQYGVLFEAMVTLEEEGKPVDLITVQNRLKEMDVPPEISGMEFVKELLGATYTSINVVHYCEIVKADALKRKLIYSCDEIANSCYEGKESVNDLFQDTEEKIFDLVQRRSTADYVPIHDVVVNALNKINAASRNNGGVTGVATGFIELDRMTAGFQPSDLVIIAARPSMGKTAFVLNVADYVCFKSKKSAAIFSLEMSSEMLVNRLLSQESHVDAQNIRTGRLEDQEWDALVEAADTVGSSRLIIDDTPGISIGELQSRCRKYKMDKDIDVIIIDYLQLMSGNGKTESRQNEIAMISRGLKSLARELNVPVIALSQLSRAVEKREDHRPMLSDLRESGGIEQDADVIMFLYRDEYYNKESAKKGIGELIVAKQRNGPIGTVELAWLSQYTRFANISRDNRHNA